MIPELGSRPIPQWLETLKTLDYFPVKEVVTRSVYYPASGSNGAPVQYLGGHIHSFVYADYGLEHSDVQREFDNPETRFAGYRIILQRKVEAEELYHKGYESISP